MTNDPVVSVVDSRQGSFSATVGESGEALAAEKVLHPDPEAVERPKRRRFTADYKVRILELADQCTEPGSLGRLLRKEGLYSSTLSEWRRQREQGVLQGLSPAKRGRKGSDSNPLLAEVARLRKENQRLTKRLEKAELLIEVQKKISQLLGLENMERSN